MLDWGREAGSSALLLLAVSPFSSSSYLITSFKGHYQGIGVTLTLPALIRPSQIGKDLMLLPITDVPEEFIFALVYRRVGSISRAARSLINVISQQLMKNMQPST